MFFHTHVHYTKIVAKKPDHLMVLGSFLPDLALTSIISWDMLHKKEPILSFNEFIKKTHPEFIPLTRGIHFHNTVDYVTHIRFKQDLTGYAYGKITPQLVTLVGQALNVPEERAKISAHNFIECAVEMRVVQQYPEIHTLIEDSVAALDKEKLVTVMSEYCQLPIAAISASIETFLPFASDYDLTSMEEWQRLWKNLSAAHLHTTSDPERVKEAIQLSLQLTEHNYNDFLSEIISNQTMNITDCN